jgi:TRAP-type mannitol/chloroaromatic compound transport system substrate-binding protein
MRQKMTDNNTNSRRDFVRKLGMGAAASAAVVATGCSSSSQECDTGEEAVKKFNWKMVTSWPKNFPGLGTGAEYLAKSITEMSGGRLTVKLYAAGELVPAFEVFDAVSRGTAEMGHAAAYYWKGKVPAAQFFTAVPFGLNATEMSAWLHEAGGLDLWRKLYAPFNIVPFQSGNTGVQMGGWYNKEINSVDDLKGLKIRMPGLAGEVIQRMGGTPLTIPGGELFTALQSGAIDATEWVGPWNDMAFGFHKAAKYYYYPGWHEPGPALEATINKDAWETLPADLQQIVEVACKASTQKMLDEYTANNNRALNSLVNEHDVQLRKFPDEVLAALKVTTDSVLEDLAETDETSREIYESFTEFRDQVAEWPKVSEVAYFDTRK